MTEYKSIEYCINHVIAEITRRDVEQVSERLHALGWEEVVRCKDCRHYVVDENPIDPGWPMMCERIGEDMLHPDCFCCWGHRKEKE